MAIELQLAPGLRLLAWLALLGIGLWTWARRPDAAGRAFAFWAVVWAWGVQGVLSLQAMATDAATQQWLYRVAYYSILFSSSAFLVVLVHAPRRVARARAWLTALLTPPLVAALAFAWAHGAFITESLGVGAYSAANTAPLQVGFPAAVWTGFLAAMLWLGWRAPSLEPRARGSATWMMAGLALFAADRFARTAALWVRDPATLGEAPEGWVYGLFMLGFGVAVLWMVLRARPIPEGANVTLAALAGAAVGFTAIATFGVAGGTTVPVLLSALLGPLYGALLAIGVLEAPADSVAYARRGRAAVLTEA